MQPVSVVKQHVSWDSLQGVRPPRRAAVLRENTYRPVNTTRHEQDRTLRSIAQLAESKAFGGRKAATGIAKTGLPPENAVKTAVVELQAAENGGLSDPGHNAHEKPRATWNHT